MALGEVVDKATDVFRDGIFAPTGAMVAEPYIDLASPYIHIAVAMLFIFMWWIVKMAFHRHHEEKEVRKYHSEKASELRRAARPKSRTV